MTRPKSPKNPEKPNNLKNPLKTGSHSSAGKTLAPKPLTPRTLAPRTFAQLLRDARHERGVSHSVLQRTSGIHFSHISSLERAKRGPTLETVVRLAEGLGMTASELLAGLDPNDPVLMKRKRREHKEKQALEGGAGRLRKRLC